MLNEMIEEQNNTMVLKEPERVADWDDAILDAPFPRPKPLSGKTFAIRLLHVLYHSDKTLTKDRMGIIKDTIRDYPELSDEVRELFPTVFE